MTSEHFLIGSPITYPDVTDVKMNRSISPGNALTVLKIMAMQLSASSPTTNQMEKYGSETFGVSNGSSKERKPAIATKEIGSHYGNVLSLLFI